VADVLTPAVVAAAAALLGVALGALLEPLKLRASERARVRQGRAERCERIIDAAMICRARLLSLNLAYRTIVAGLTLEGDNEAERLEAYRLARYNLRTAVALLRLCGPDDLVDAAMRVREEERSLRKVRFAPDDGDDLDKDWPPQPVLKHARAVEQAVHDFAATARRYVR
jgi:hypothetical protein